MNKVYLILLFGLLSFTGLSQYDSKGEDEVSRFRAGFMWYYTGLRPASPEKVRKYDRLIFDIVYSDWAGDRDPFSNHWASIGLNTNMMFDIPLSKGNTFALGIGVAHQYMNIRHNGNLLRHEVDKKTTFLEKSDLDAFKKSVLGGNSFAIPVELRFRKESWKHFKFHIGGKVGYQANLYTRYLTKTDGTKEVKKTVGFYDANDLIYSAHFRIGLRNWALFGSYNFNTIFSNPESVQLNVIQMGLSVSLY